MGRLDRSTLTTRARGHVARSTTSCHEERVTMHTGPIDRDVFMRTNFKAYLETKPSMLGPNHLHCAKEGTLGFLLRLQHDLTP
jgi:hypothetical protein